MYTKCPTCGRQTGFWGRCKACGEPPSKKTALREALVITGIVISLLVVMGVVVFNVDDNSFRIFRKMGLGKSPVYEVTRASENLPVPKDPPITLSPQRIEALRELFESGQFASLNTIYETYQQAFEDDFSTEYALEDAWRVFETTLPAYEKIFAAWILHSPGHFAPYLARAHYYHAKAWESWGYSAVKDKKPVQFKMRWANFQKSMADIQVALGINQQLLTAYLMLIRISYVMAKETDLQRWSQEAFNLFPSSFLLRLQYLYAISPRGMGSYRRMEEFAKSAELYVDINPHFTCLYGYIYSEQAYDLLRQKKYDDALALYTKAMAYGDDWYFYSKRAQVRYAHFKDLDKGLADVERSIYLRPTVSENFHLRSRIHFEKENFKAAAEDLQTACDLTPHHPEILHWQQWATTRFLNLGHKVFETDRQQAIEQYGFALRFDPQNKEAFYWRAAAYSHLNQHERVIEDLQNAMQLDPRHYDSYALMDYTLDQLGKSRKMMAYWDRFIELQPEHASAYLERARHYFQQNDLSRSLADVKTSCDLGNQEACDRYQRHKDQWGN